MHGKGKGAGELHSSVFGEQLIVLMGQIMQEKTEPSHCAVQERNTDRHRNFPNRVVRQSDSAFLTNHYVFCFKLESVVGLKK